MAEKEKKENNEMVKEKKEKEKTALELASREYPHPSALMREFDRMFDDFRSGFEDMLFRPFGFGRPLFEMRMPEFEREPIVDLVDLGDKFELTAEIPGIPKDKIDINLSDDGIEISAEIEGEKEEKDKEYCCRERSYRSFYRRMYFPEDVISDKANATMTDGVLKVELPKKEPKEVSKAKKLEIK